MLMEKGDPVAGAVVLQLEAHSGPCGSWYSWELLGCL